MILALANPLRDTCLVTLCLASFPGEGPKAGRPEEVNMTVSESTEQVSSVVLDLTTPEISEALSEIEARLHVLRGLLDALGRVGELNAVVQSSPTTQRALERLQEAPFRYTPDQATAVLALPLRCLSSEEVKRLNQEMEQLSARRTSLREQLSEVLALHWFG